MLLALRVKARALEMHSGRLVTGRAFFWGLGGLSEFPFNDC